jgi:hypothetical protein
MTPQAPFAEGRSKKVQKKRNVFIVLTSQLQKYAFRTEAQRPWEKKHRTYLGVLIYRLIQLEENLLYSSAENWRQLSDQFNFYITANYAATLIRKLHVLSHKAASMLLNSLNKLWKNHSSVPLR